MALAGCALAGPHVLTVQEWLVCLLGLLGGFALVLSQVLLYRCTVRRCSVRRLSVQAGLELLRSELDFVPVTHLAAEVRPLVPRHLLSIPVPTTSCGLHCGSVHPCGRARARAHACRKVSVTVGVRACAVVLMGVHVRAHAYACVRAEVLMQNDGTGCVHHRMR